MNIKHFTKHPRIKTFYHAFCGIKHVVKTQPNFQIHCVALLCVLILGTLLKLSTTEWLVITITCGCVMAAEAFNTAIELIVDFISPDYHEKAGKIKDLAAAAVLITAISAAIIGLTIFIPKIVGHLS